jgi:5-(carboxyamino)imidazole ribonucleotide mutase
MSESSTVVIICGSESDFSFAEKIATPLREKFNVELFAASAHKKPQRVLEILTEFDKKDRVVYVTIAGRSNALSGFVGANSRHVTVACPPFADKTDYLVNIHSTLQMPSKTPILTVIDPGNCALAVERILNL